VDPGFSAADSRQRDLRSGSREALTQSGVALRNNMSHRYLLRTLVNCGACRQGSSARTTWDGHSYYVRRGHHEIVAEQRCRARHAPAGQLDELVWQDLCEVLTHPEHIKTAAHVVPTSPEGPHEPFCHLRTDYLDGLPGVRSHAGAATHHVEDGVENLTHGTYPRATGSLGNWEMGLDKGPLSVGEVGLRNSNLL
jgi:hypothetical protein